MEYLQKNEIFTVTIDGYSSEAYGVCHIGGRAVFVPKTIVGEKWEIKLVKVTSTAVYARAEKLLEPAVCRNEPDCAFFGRCGGCDTRHMSYEEELRFKLARVNDALHHIGKQTLQAEEILGSESTSRYRNKGIFAFSQIDGRPVYGFYRERSHDIIQVKNCLIQNELADRAAGAVAAFLENNNIPAYSEADFKGTVRHVFCRRAVYTADAVVCIVSARGFGAHTSQLVSSLRAACPELTGIVLNINKSRGNSVMSGEYFTLWGKPEINDRLCGISFSIAPQAFYQINPKQAERLYLKALEYAAVSPASLVFDLYCGAGTISLCLAQKAGRVIGAEIVPAAVENAKANAAANNITNADFICADAGKAAQMLAARELHPECVVVDPPRKGMDEAAIAAVSSMQPERVVYVSCNPATLARDIFRFSEYGYTLTHATAVDMFPKTCHVESVVLMSRA